MKDIIRDSSIGQLLNSISGGRILPYADQRAGYVIPDRYRVDSLSRAASRATLIGDTTPPDLKKTLSVEKYISESTLPTRPQSAVVSSATSIRTIVRESIIPTNLEAGDTLAEKLRDELTYAQIHPELAKPENLDLVDWYGPDDSDNPR